MQPSPTWQNCPLCRHLPEQSRSFEKGSETLVSTIPPEAEQLEVVGAPFFNKDTSSSNQCLLQCPRCKTYYAWDFVYEYLVNGSEDDLTLTRVTPTEGAARHRAALQRIAEHRAWFLDQAPAHLAALNRAPRSPHLLRLAAEFFFMHGPRRGVDIHFALPQLIHAFKRCGAKNPILWTLRLTLETYGAQNEAQYQALNHGFQVCGMQNHPRALGVLAICQRQRSQNTQPEPPYV